MVVSCEVHEMAEGALAIYKYVDRHGIVKGVKRAKQ